MCIHTLVVQLLLDRSFLSPNSLLLSLLPKLYLPLNPPNLQLLSYSLPKKHRLDTSSILYLGTQCSSVVPAGITFLQFKRLVTIQTASISLAYKGYLLPIL